MVSEGNYKKLHGADSRDWGKLLEVAWVAYSNRDELQSKMNEG